MSWNAFLVSLGARHSSSVRRIPKDFLRMTAAALQDPVTPTAAVGYIADQQWVQDCVPDLLDRAVRVFGGSRQLYFEPIGYTAFGEG